MDPAHGWLIILLFWALLIPLAAYFLQMACNLCGADDLPSIRKAALVTIGVAAAAFLLYDSLGYFIFRNTGDVTNLQLPPGYGYAQWLAEPVYLKWQALGVIPVLRYLPLVFAFCLAAILYTVILRLPYRISAVIFLLQWTLNIVAMAVLTFVFNLVLGFLGQQQAPPGATGGPSARTPQQVRPQQRAMTRPGQRPPQVAPQPPGAPPASGLSASLAAHSGQAASSTAWLSDRIDALRQFLDPYLEPVKQATAPYTQYLPPSVQEFLDDGGWWLVLAALVVVVAIWLRRTYRRLRRALFGRRKRKKAAKLPKLREDLLLVSDAFTEVGPKQVTVRSHPGRLRLVILAPASSYVGDLWPDMAENLLDYVVPGLGEVLEGDAPGVRVWPRQSSESQFFRTFFEMVQIPEARGRASNWVLLAGTIRLGRQKVQLGLAVFLDRAGYQREIRVEKEKWQDVLGLQEVKELV